MVLRIIIYSLFTLYLSSSSSWLENDTFLIVSILAVLITFFIKGCKFDKEIFYVLTVWTLINIFSYFINDSNTFSIATFGSLTMRMLMPYFMLKIIGKGFFDGLHKYLFALCLISFPFFLIESIDPAFIQSLAPSLNFMTMDEQKASGGFYIFVYMHSGWAQYMYDFSIRNSGFMWEPGAYAAVLSFMIVYQLFKNNFKITYKTIFLVICMLTTYSTSGFIALFSIIIMFFFYNRTFYKKYKYFIPIIIIPLVMGGYYLYRSADFMENKIENYLEQGTKTNKWEYKGNKALRVNRIAYMQIALESSIHNPIGNGITANKYIATKYHNAKGPNSLATILIQWGWIGLIVVLYCIYNFKIKGLKAGFILLIPLAICLFSNPFSFRYLIFAIVFSIICKLDDQEEVLFTTDEESSDFIPDKIEKVLDTGSNLGIEASEINM